jgi:hypothetical protein
LVFTKAAFDERPAPNRADPGPAPPVRVILPAYAEPAPGIISAPDQTQTDAQAAKPDLQPAQEATKAVAQVEKADVRGAERKSGVAARRQAERKARKIAAAGQNSGWKLKGARNGPSWPLAPTVPPLW